MTGSTFTGSSLPDAPKFEFVFETDGSLTAQQTLDIALKILEKKFDDFRELVSSLESAA